MLFSATQTKKVEDLTRLSIQGKPVFVGAHDLAPVATVGGLEQGYVVCPSDKRFLLLFTFLRRNRNKKVRCSVFHLIVGGRLAPHSRLLHLSSMDPTHAFTRIRRTRCR